MQELFIFFFGDNFFGFLAVSDKKKHTINKKLREKKLFIYVVFTYRQGKIFFFFSLNFLLPAFVEAGTTKKPYA